MRVPLVCLLLSSAVAFSGAGVILEPGSIYPVLWSHATAAVTDLPIVENVLNPDPWHAQHRMSFYKILIAATDPGMSSMGPGENQNPMWGLPLQLGWMLTSGRMADPTGQTQCGVEGGDTCISTNSWWGCVNYFSSVLPFLSAAKEGILVAGTSVPVQMQIPAGVEGYCLTYDACKTAFNDPMTNWDNFYQGLKAIPDPPLPDNERKDQILGLYWRAALSSTHASAAFCQDMLGSYSGVEKAFAQSWMNAGEYVAAVYFQSSLNVSTQFMTPLPGRILKDEDSAPGITDLTTEENQTINVFSWMASADSWLGGSMVNFWRNAMCNVERREKGREILGKLLFDPAYVTGNFITFLPSIATGC